MVGCSPFSVGSIRNKHHPNVAEYISDYGSEMYIYFLFNPGDNSMNRCQIQLDFHSESVSHSCRSDRCYLFVSDHTIFFHISQDFCFNSVELYLSSRWHTPYWISLDFNEISIFIVSWRIIDPANEGPISQFRFYKFRSFQMYQ